jgi:hypothetical protein
MMSDPTSQDVLERLRRLRMTGNIFYDPNIIPDAIALIERDSVEIAELRRKLEERRHDD